jgi:Tfp pilus assembly protein PilF
MSYLVRVFKLSSFFLILICVRCTTYDAQGMRELATRYLIKADKLQLAKHHKQAEEAYKHAIALDAMHSEPIDKLASFYEARNQIDKADYYYQKALLYGSKASAFNNYGIFLCRHKHYRKGVTYLLRVCQQKEAHATVSCYKAYHNAALCAKKIPDPALEMRMEQLATNMTK